LIHKRGGPVLQLDSTAKKRRPVNAPRIASASRWAGGDQTASTAHHRCRRIGSSRKHDPRQGAFAARILLRRPGIFHYNTDLWARCQMVSNECSYRAQDLFAAHLTARAHKFVMADQLVLLDVGTVEALDLRAVLPAVESLW
jgi:hypothetical protein